MALCFGIKSDVWRTEAGGFTCAMRSRVFERWFVCATAGLVFMVRVGAQQRAGHRQVSRAQEVTCCSVGRSTQAGPPPVTAPPCGHCLHLRECEDA